MQEQDDKSEQQQQQHQHQRQQQRSQPQDQLQASAEQVESPTRRLIIDAARREFAALGKAGARVDRIAAAAGVNKAMIYYHFQSKDNLYIEVIRDFYRLVKVIAYRDLDQTVSFETTLTVLAETYASMFDRIAEFKPILLRELANPNPAVLEEIVSVFREAGIIPRILARSMAAQEAGEIRQMDLRHAMISFVVMNLGYIFMAPLLDRLIGITDSRAFVQERKKIVVDIFLNGIKPR
jgi:AcrR family transcriptional regulator